MTATAIADLSMLENIRNVCTTAINYNGTFGRVAQSVANSLAYISLLAVKYSSSSISFEVLLTGELLLCEQFVVDKVILNHLDRMFARFDVSPGQQVR
jgi:hypothetical protein